MLARVHLPDLPRNGAGDFFAELHAPELTLPKVELPKVELPKVELPKVELPRLEAAAPALAKVVSDAGVALGVRRPPRPTWPLALGGVALAVAAAALAAWALLRDQARQSAIARAADQARTWATGMRAAVMRRLGRRTELISIEAAPAAPAESPGSPIAEMVVGDREFVESGEPC